MFGKKSPRFAPLLSSQITLDGKPVKQAPLPPEKPSKSLRKKPKKREKKCFLGLRIFCGKYKKFVTM